MQASDLLILERSNIPGYVVFTNNNGNDVQLTDVGDSYQEVTQSPNSPYSTSQRYFKVSLNLKSEVALFYDFPIGIDKEYNKDGLLTNELNHDTDYLFTVSDLITKAADDFNIDLLTPVERQNVLREYNDSDVPVYVIVVPTGENSYRRLTISGTTGDVLNDETGGFVE